MKRRTRWPLGVAAAGIEHHREAAARYNLWPPSHQIFLGGVAATALGAGSLGFALGRRPAA